MSGALRSDAGAHGEAAPVPPLLVPAVRYLTFLTMAALSACAMTPEQNAAQAERDYGAACEKRGLASGSEQWRACIETESLNAALASQRAYEQEFLRQRDCVNPLLGCSGPSR